MLTVEPADIIATASHVEARLKLTNLRLQESRALASAPMAPGLLSSEMNINVKSGRDDGRVVMRVEYDIKASSVEAPGELCWQVMCAFVVEYTHSRHDTFSDQDLEAFGVASATLSVHPYARAFVQAMTTQMGYPAFSLPLVTMQTLADMSTMETIA